MYLFISFFIYFFGLFIVFENLCIRISLNSRNGKQSMEKEDETQLQRNFLNRLIKELI